MITPILTVIQLFLTSCAGPEPDDAIVAVPDLSDHPGHPCAPLLPDPRRAPARVYEAAERCVVEHCVGRVEAMDPEGDAAQLRTLCLGGFELRSRVPRGCHLSACERLLPAMPGLLYQLDQVLLMPEERARVFAPLAGSSELLAAVLELGERTDCGTVWQLGSSLTVLQLEGTPLPWDEAALRAGQRLAAWELAHCRHDRPTVPAAMSFAERR